MTFLRVFLAVLTVAFVIAVIARVRSYSSQSSETVAGASSTISGPSSPTAPHGRGGDPSTYTIVPSGAATPSTSKQPGATPSPASAQLTREQAYRELLKGGTAQPPGTVVAGPPPGATKPAAKPQPQPQSTIAKILQPIKNFFNGSSSNTPPPAPIPQPKSPENPPRQERQEKDPTTDTTPPQVTAIAFDPPQVSDGDPVTVIVTAVDDMSGIRGISGTVTSPSGKALQGFAATREAEGSNRYLGRLTIPKNAEAGLWRINFLNLADNASNSVTLSYQQAPVLQTAALRVTSSGPDNQPPVLKGVWIDRRGMRAGEKNTLFAQVEDDKSGVGIVSGDFISPSKIARIGFACRGGDNDVWSCEFTTPVCLDCGDWSLEQIQMQDKASNLGAARQDNALITAVKLNITGDSCDNTAPVLQSLHLDMNSVPSTPDGTFVNVEVIVSDDMCGVASVSAQVVPPSGGNGQFFPFSTASEPNMWVGRMPIPRLAGKGTWRINWLQVMDKGNNLRVYYASDPLLANAVVQVR